MAGLKILDLSKTERVILNRKIEEAGVILKGSKWVSASSIELDSWIATEKLISDPQFIKSVVKKLRPFIKSKEIEAVAACSLAGIPWATAVSSMYNLPLIIIRKRKEDHGERSSIIGDTNLVRKKRFLLVDDSILTGKTVKRFYNLMKKFGYVVNDIFVFDLWSNATTRANLERWVKKNNLTIVFVKNFVLKI